MSRFHREHPETPHPFALSVECVLNDEWRELQAEIRAEQGCTGDECDGCDECWPDCENTIKNMEG